MLGSMYFYSYEFFLLGMILLGLEKHLQFWKQKVFHCHQSKTNKTIEIYSTNINNKVSFAAKSLNTQFAFRIESFSKNYV